MSSRQSNEDLFDSSRMSFGEHLEELRKVLVWSLWGVVPACALGFLFATSVVQILNKPLIDAMKDYNDHRVEQELIERNGFVPPEYAGRMKDDGLLPKQIFMDPGQVLKRFQPYMPDIGTNLEVVVYGFSTGNFKPNQISELCKRFESQKGDSSAQTAQLKDLWGRLTAEEQGVIKSVAKSKDPNERLDVVMTIFNRLSKIQTLSDAAVFKDDLTEVETGFLSSIFVKPKPKPLAKMKTKLSETADLYLNRRLNRALISGLFPEQVAPLKVDLEPFEVWEQSKFEPQSLGASEGFLAWLKAGIFTGLILSGPWIFYQLWSFVATGLYPHERKYIHIFLPVSIGLFIAGVLLAFFFVFQPVLGFLFSFNQAMGVAPEIRFNEWLSFVMFLPLGFGTAFQLPLVMLFMYRIGLFKIEDYLSKWRIAVMVIFVLAMFLTPADPISMLLLAVPLTGLYFLGIALCRWMPKIENPYGDDAALADT